MKCQGVIFDFNGTMFFDDEFHFIAWSKIVKELTGETLTMAMLGQMNGKNNKEIIAMFRDDLSVQESQAYSAKKEALYRQACLEHPDELHLVTGLPELLDELVAKKIPFTIASASIKDNIDFFVEVFNLEKWFNLQTIVYDDGTSANKQEMFTKAAALLNIELTKTLIFEDSKSGITGAKALKTMIVGIGDVTRFDDLKTYGADVCICDYREFDFDLLED